MSGDERGDEPSASRIVRFDAARHDVAAFNCGNDALDSYIRVTVGRDAQQHTAVTYVLVSDSEGTHVLGYFTLNSFAFAKRQARRRDRDRYLGSYDPVPAVLIGRLALDQSMQGRGLGSLLLVAALTRILAIREEIGAAVVVVHAIDETATAFYEHQGFTPFRDEQSHFYYPLAVFEAGSNANRSAEAER